MFKTVSKKKWMRRRVNHARQPTACSSGRALSRSCNRENRTTTMSAGALSAWWRSSLSLGLALACLISILAESARGQPLLLKTETFDADPGWDGRNNRATDPAPRQIVQNIGFNSSSTNAGGSAGEIGGFITPAGETAFYGKVIAPTSFNDPLSASGILNVPQGGGHTLIGFFNADTANEWRTPNTIALRIYGRGTYFLAYLEYGTGLWRAGGTSFGGEAAIPSGAANYPFSLNYDPNGAGGLGTVTATIGSYSTVMTLDSGHKADGAIFNRFGILNVMKSADDPGDRKSTRLNSSHGYISYAVFCLKKKNIYI